MATTFSILTFLILCLSVIVSIKNNEQMKEEIEKKQTSLKNLKINQEELKSKQVKLADLRVKITETQQETLKSTSDEEVKLREINSKLKVDVDSKTRKIASNQLDLDGMEKTLSEIGLLNELVSKSKEMRLQSQELDEIGAKLESSHANLKAENKASEDLAQRLEENLEIIGRGSSLPSFKTRIHHIYPNWGFVILASGYQSGVTGGSSLDVVRDDKVVGKLLVSTVERNSASASIVPDSIGEDITLRIGDQVVATPEK